MARRYSAYPDMTLDPSKSYTATIKTNRGDIELELLAADAPKTVNNFVYLARDGFYDGLSFHRVIPGFVAQGGCPHGTGTGGPGYTFEDETRGNPYRHEAGSLSMANAGSNTNGSQFFICHEPQPHLNGKHTVFGKVTGGMDVVLSLEQGDFMEKILIAEAWLRPEELQRYAVICRSIFRGQMQRPDKTAHVPFQALTGRWCAVRVL